MDRWQEEACFIDQWIRRYSGEIFMYLTVWYEGQVPFVYNRDDASLQVQHFAGLVQRTAKV